MKHFARALIQKPARSWDQWYADAIAALSEDHAAQIRKMPGFWEEDQDGWWFGFSFEDKTTVEEEIAMARMLLSSLKNADSESNLADLLTARRIDGGQPLSDDDVLKITARVFKILPAQVSGMPHHLHFAVTTARLLGVRDGILWEGTLRSDLERQLHQRIPGWQNEFGKTFSIYVKYPHPIPIEELKGDAEARFFSLFDRSSGNPLNSKNLAGQIVQIVETDIGWELPADTTYRIVRARDPIYKRTRIYIEAIPPAAGLEETLTLDRKVSRQAVQIPISGSGTSTSLESPPITLLVQPEWKGVMKEKFGGVPGLILTDDPRVATFIAGDPEFLAQIKRQSGDSQAFFLQADSQSMDQLTPAFLVNLMAYIQREKLPSGTTLVIGGLVYDDLRQTITALTIFV